MDLTQDLTDEQLVILLQTGDEVAFTTIYNRYWNKLLAMGYHYTKDRAAAEEVLQDVFLQLWDRRDQVVINRLSAYLATAVKFSIFQQLLKVKRREALAAANYTPPVVQLDEEHIQARFLEEYLQGVVETLPEKCRLVYKYSRHDALPVNDIARTMNISPKTVEAHLSKALKALKGSLRQIGGLFFDTLVLLMATFFY